jgi:hypothetical protein
MSEKTLPQLQIEEEIRIRNLKFQQEQIHHEHVMLQTVQMKKIAGEVAREILESGHYCVQGERIVRMESKIDILLERQEERIKKDDEYKKEVTTAISLHSKKITAIETTNKTLTTICGVVVAAWCAGKLKFFG